MPVLFFKEKYMAQENNLEVAPKEKGVGPDNRTDSERREFAEKNNQGYYIGKCILNRENDWSIFEVSDTERNRPLGFRYFSWDEAMDRCKSMIGAYKAGRESIAEEIMENIKKMK
jgi:hypothetical protein